MASSEEFFVMLKDLLKCSNCEKCIMNSSSILQCSNGNLMCLSCLESLGRRKCSSCNASKRSHGRAFFVEKLLKILPKPCKFMPLRCYAQFLTELERTQHEEQCEYQHWKDSDPLILVRSLNGNRADIAKAILQKKNIPSADLPPSAFFLACGNNQVEIVKMLLEKMKKKAFQFSQYSEIKVGNKTNTVCLNGLEMAVMKGHIETVEEIIKHALEHKVELHDACTKRDLPLFYYALLSEKGLEMIKLLLENAKKLSLDPREKHETSILSFAFELENPPKIETLKYLLHNAAQFDSNGFASELVEAFQESCSRGHLEIAKCLLEASDDWDKFKSYEAFSLACSNGQVEVVRFLLENDKMKHVEFWRIPIVHVGQRKSTGGRPPDSWLLEQKKMEGVKLNGEIPPSKNGLIEACRKNHWKVVELLVQFRKRIDLYADHEGKAKSLDAFLVACYCKNIEVLKVILKHHKFFYLNAKLNVHKYRTLWNPDQSLFSGLKFACLRGDYEIVELIFKAKKDCKRMRITYNDISLQYAIVKGHERIVELLLSNENPFKTNFNKKQKLPFMNFKTSPIFIAVKYGRTEIVKVLIKRDDINFNEVNSAKKLTAFHLACHLGHVEMIKILLGVAANKRLDVNLEDSDGLTGLDWTFKENHSEASRLILEAAFQKKTINVNIKRELALHYDKTMQEIKIKQDMAALMVKGGCMDLSQLDKSSEETTEKIIHLPSGKRARLS